MKKLIAALIVTLLIGQVAWGAHTCMIGGARSGLALGISADQHLSDSVWGRFEMEGTTGEDASFTGDNPFVMAGDLRLYIAKLGTWQSPLSIGVGLVGVYGVSTQMGSCLSLMLEKINGQEPLLLEFGFDFFGDHGHVTAQLGYRVY